MPDDKTQLKKGTLDEVIRGQNAWNNAAGGIRGEVLSLDDVNREYARLGSEKKPFWLRRYGAWVLGGIAALATAGLIYFSSQEPEIVETIVEKEVPVEVIKEIKVASQGQIRLQLKEAQYTLRDAINSAYKFVKEFAENGSKLKEQEKNKHTKEYYGIILNGLSQKEIEGYIRNNISPFCETSQRADEKKVKCDNWGLPYNFTWGLGNLTEVVGLIDKDNVGSSVIVGTFREKEVTFAEEIKDKSGLIEVYRESYGMDRYSLTRFSKDFLRDEDQFFWWIGKEHERDINYDKIKEVSLVLTYPPATPKNIETGEEVLPSMVRVEDLEKYVIYLGTTPLISFRIMYYDHSVKMIPIEGCKDRGEMLSFCTDKDFERCIDKERDKLGETNKLREVACRIQDANGIGLLETPKSKKQEVYGYDFELVKWTTTYTDIYLVGKENLTDIELEERIYHLTDLFRTYIEQRGLPTN